MRICCYKSKKVLLALDDHYFKKLMPQTISSSSKHWTAIGCTEICQIGQQIEVSVHSHCVENSEYLVQQYVGQGYVEVVIKNTLYNSTFCLHKKKKKSRTFYFSGSIQGAQARYKLTRTSQASTKTPGRTTLTFRENPSIFSPPGRTCTCSGHI